MKTIKERIMDYVSNVFYLDLRSLALLRIGLGALSLFNLFCLYPYLDAFYGAHGIAPLAWVKSELEWSFYSISDNYYFIRFIFILHIFVALLLTLGKYTRVATIACFLLTISYVHRMPLVAYGADSMMITFLMWGIFLPLGARYSLDSRMSHQKEIPTNKFVSMFTVAFIIQIIFLYLFNAIGKHDASWWRDYTAVYYALSTYEFSSVIGSWFLQYPDILKAFTLFAWILEYTGSFFLLLPFCHALFRNLAIIAFMFFHFSILLTMNVGWFSVVTMVVWAALIPSTWWQRLTKGNTRLSSVTVTINKGSIVLVIAMLVFIFVQNYEYFRREIFKHKKKDSIVLTLAKQSGIFQRWTMFAPHPPKTTRKYYYLPQFENDKFNQDVLLAKPVEIKENERWYKYFFNIRQKVFAKYLTYLKNYLTHHWNESNPPHLRIKGVDIFYSEEWISPLENTRLIKHFYDSDRKPIVPPDVGLL